MRGLKDKRYVIGGGTTGIGAALARRLVEEGARVMVGDINAAGLEALSASTNRAILTEVADLSEPEPVERLIARAAEEFGGIDGLAITVADLSKNNMGRDYDLTNFLPEVWERTMRVNVIGHALLIKAAIPHLKAAGSGSCRGRAGRRCCAPANAARPWTRHRPAARRWSNRPRPR
jgi:NAD(P)-dependent dehydrogenase (short-subunit alcohol dehydrogenase family)